MQTGSRRLIRGSLICRESGVEESLRIGGYIANNPDIRTLSNNTPNSLLTHFDHLTGKKRIIQFGVTGLGRAIREFVEHCHRDHNNQGLDAGTQIAPILALPEKEEDR
jgi:hypothetical protein